MNTPSGFVDNVRASVAFVFLRAAHFFVFLLAGFRFLTYFCHRKGYIK